METTCYQLILSYRDQNFGLNDLAAIQDVRNDFNLQDITDEPPATKDRGKFKFRFNLTNKHKRGVMKMFVFSEKRNISLMQ